MASQAALDLVIGLKDNASSGIGKITGALGSLAKIGGAALLGGAVAGVGALGAALVTGIGDAREAAKVMAQTEAVIKSTGGAAGFTADQIADMAGSLSAASGKSLFGDDDIQRGQNMLLTFTNIKETLPDATQTMLDMATAMGTDAESGAVALGKALNDPIAGISALSRVGVTFSEDQKKVIERLVETGDVAGAQKVILAELNKEFGGSAQAAADADGGLAQFKDRLGETAETLGASMMPAMNSLLDILNSDGVQSGIQSIADALGTGLQTAVTWLGDTGLPALTTGFDTVKGVLSSIITPIQDATTAFTTWSAFGTEWGIVAALESIGESFPLVEPFTTWLSDKVPGIFDTARTAIDTFKTGWDTLKTAFEEGGIQGAFQLVLDKVLEIFPGLEPITTWLETTLPPAIETAKGVLDTIKTAFTDWYTEAGGLDGILTTVKDSIGKVGDAIGAATTFVNDHVVVQGVLVGILGAIAAGYALSTAAAIAHGIATKATTLATTLMTAAQTALNVVMSANPLALVIIALAGLAAGLIYAYNNSETFRKTVDGLWADFLRGIEVIKTWAAGVKERFDEMVGDFKRGWNLITTNVTETWNTIKTTVSEKFTEIVTTVSTKIDEIKTFFTELPGKITTALGNLGATLLQAGKDLINGLIEGVKSIDVGSILGGIVTGGIAAAKRLVGIKSPSTKTRDEIGKPMGEGIVVGLESTAESLKQAVGKTVLGAIQVADLVPTAIESGKAVGDAFKQGASDALDRTENLKQIFGGKLRNAVEIATEDVKQIFGGKLRAALEPEADAAGTSIAQALIDGFNRRMADFNFGGQPGMVFVPGPGNTAPPPPSKGDRTFTPSSASTMQALTNNNSINITINATDRRSAELGVRDALVAGGLL